MSVTAADTVSHALQCQNCDKNPLEMTLSLKYVLAHVIAEPTNSFEQDGGQPCMHVAAIL